MTAPPFPTSCTSPTPPLHPLIPTLQLLFWISQIAPVRSSVPSLLPPTEQHCTLPLAPSPSPPRVSLSSTCRKTHADVLDRCVSKVPLWAGLQRFQRAAPAFFLFRSRKARRCWRATHTSRCCCCSKPDKERPKFFLLPWNSPSLSTAPLVFFMCQEGTLLFFFVCECV